VEGDDRDRLRRMAIEILSAGDRSDGGDFVREIAGGEIGHHAAVGQAGDEEAIGINGIIAFEFSDERAEEGDIIDIVFEGVGAAVSGVPGEEMIFEPAGAVGIGDQEIFLVSLKAHARHFFGAFGIASAAVNDDHHGKGCFGVVGGRGVDEVGAGAAVDLDLAIVAIGSGVDGAGSEEKADGNGEGYAGDEKDGEDQENKKADWQVTGLHGWYWI